MVAQTEMVFKCQGCGECCSSWNLPIEAEKAEALLEREWVRERLRETGRTLSPISKELYRLPLTNENYCVFLAEDKRCLIEANEGRELKPLECKRFPFASVRLPTGGIGHDTSATCKTIAENAIPNFLPVVPAGEVPVELVSETLPERVRVTPFRRISWTDYEACQEALWRIFTHSTTPPPLALKQTQQLLRGLPRISGERVEAFDFHPAWERVVPALFLRKPYGNSDVVTVWQEGEYWDAKIFGVPISLRGLHRVGWSSESLSPLLKGFLYNVMRRKVLLAYGHNLTDLLGAACVAYFLLRWYARALALVQEKPEVDAEDLTLAIRLTERYYTGHQPRFLEFFRRSPAGWLAADVLLGL